MRFHDGEKIYNKYKEKTDKNNINNKIDITYKTKLNFTSTNIIKK